MAFWPRYIGGFRHVRAREDRPAGRWANSQASVSKTRPEGCVRDCCCERRRLHLRLCYRVRLRLILHTYAATIWLIARREKNVKSPVLGSATLQTRSV
jgi:hypothetical protein